MPTAMRQYGERAAPPAGPRGSRFAATAVLTSQTIGGGQTRRSPPSTATAAASSGSAPSTPAGRVMRRTRAARSGVGGEEEPRRVEFPDASLLSRATELGNFQGGYRPNKSSTGIESGQIFFKLVFYRY